MKLTAISWNRFVLDSTPLIIAGVLVGAALHRSGNAMLFGDAKAAMSALIAGIHA